MPAAKGPLGRLGAWLRGDRYMVGAYDPRPPTVAVERDREHERERAAAARRDAPAPPRTPDASSSHPRPEEV